jgi:hypothetical protein
MDKNILIAVIALAPVLLVASCSEAPKPAETKAEAKTEPAKPAGPVAGKTAFFEMYKPAQRWASDLLPLSLASNDVPGIPTEDGKAPAWTAVFVSPSRREARTFFYAVADHGDNIRKGVTSSGAASWSGATPQSKPFSVSEFSVNSDAAYKAAYEKAASWVKKNPGKKVSLFLASSSRFPAPVWYVLWGNTKVGYMVFVNATTGMVLK